MKKVILSLILATCTGMFCSLNAQEYKIPAKVVVITKQDVNIRKAPQTSAAVVEKASTGAMYELISQQGSWYEVKDIKTGNNVYVSATVGRLATGNQISRTDKGLVEKEESTDFYLPETEKDAERGTNHILRILSETGKEYNLRYCITDNRFDDRKYVYPRSVL